MPLHVSSTVMLIIRRSKLYYPASGIITPVGGRPVRTGCRVHYTSSCKHSLALLMMGEIIARNILSWLKLLLKIIFLHPVGCLYYCIN